MQHRNLAILKWIYWIFGLLILSSALSYAVAKDKLRNQNAKVRLSSKDNLPLSGDNSTKEAKLLDAMRGIKESKTRRAIEINKTNRTVSQMSANSTVINATGNSALRNLAGRSLPNLSKNMTDKAKISTNGSVSSQAPQVQGKQDGPNALPPSKRPELTPRSSPESGTTVSSKAQPVAATGQSPRSSIPANPSAQNQKNNTAEKNDMTSPKELPSSKSVHTAEKTSASHNTSSADGNQKTSAVISTLKPTKATVTPGQPTRKPMESPPLITEPKSTQPGSAEKATKSAPETMASANSSAQKGAHFPTGTRLTNDPEPAKTQSRANVVSTTPESAVPGTCSNKQLRFSFDPKTKTCNAFVYSGCGGKNKNVFLTMGACYNACRDFMDSGFDAFLHIRREGVAMSLYGEQ